MSTTIYWFSGTGNSLAVARAIADRTDDAALVPITATLGERRVYGEGTIGIVCPVYFYSLPLVVKEFIERLDVSKADYAFVVVTMGGMPGMAIEHARSLLRRAGRNLDAEYALMMPGNYIAEYNVRGDDAVRRMTARAGARAADIADAIRSKRRRRSLGPLFFVPLSALIYALAGRWFAKGCRERDERFTVSSACIGCGSCVRVCPVDNIEMADDRPSWRHHCEQCYACIHFCPECAIQLRGGKTERRRRYHHPDVTLGDIAVQREAGV
jgi:ferredoxin